MKYIVFTLLLGCQSPTVVERACDYRYDHRTDLCFMYKGHGIAHVPCTPKVLAQIEQCK